DADPSAARQCLAMLAAKAQSGEVAGPQLAALKKELLPVLHGLMKGNGPLSLDAAVLGASLRDPDALADLRKRWYATEQFEETMLTVLEALTAAGDASILDSVGAGLADPKTGSPRGRARMLAALARLNEPRVARVVLASYPKMEPELQPRAIDL